MMPEEGTTEWVTLDDIIRPVAAVSGTAPIKDEGVLQGADMLWMRKMIRFEAREVIREELATAVERFFAQGLRRLESAIHAQPHDEQEEIIAILATLKSEELEAIIVRVRERQS